ncbi:MAG: GTP cyclohydrolase II [Bacteroidota bacterium]
MATLLPPSAKTTQPSTQAQTLRRQAEALIPMPWGNFHMMAYASEVGEWMPHLALVHEDFQPGEPTVIRMHSECITGDLFGSRRCDCGEQLDAAMTEIAKQKGILLYLRQEGRGIGIINKLKAYELQDEGLDTIQANEHLGLEVDARQYDIAVAMLQDLDVAEVHLLTNNPEKINALDDSPIRILSRLPIVIPPHADNAGYLRTKQQDMGHLFDLF